jgi:hypothetical protein
MRSKIQIRTSSRNKAQLALLRDEVRILIFDDAAEQERGQRPEFSSAQLDSSTNPGSEGPKSDWKVLFLVIFVAVKSDDRFYL